MSVSTVVRVARGKTDETSVYVMNKSGSVYKYKREVLKPGYDNFLAGLKKNNNRIKLRPQDWTCVRKSK